MYWCSTETSGTVTPMVFARSRVHCPQHSTSFSHATSPWAVRMPASRPFSTTIPVTGQSSTIIAPCIRAPLARACAMSDGLACPSVGRKAAPTTSPISISGHRSCASCGVRSCMSSPKLCAVVAWRLTSVQRSALQASLSPPFIFQPVASPVSASSRS